MIATTTLLELSTTTATALLLKTTKGRFDEHSVAEDELKDQRKRPAAIDEGNVAWSSSYCCRLCLVFTL